MEEGIIKAFRRMTMVFILLVMGNILLLVSRYYEDSPIKKYSMQFAIFIICYFIAYFMEEKQNEM